MLKGIEWVLNDSISRQTVNPGVVNMSLGGGKSAILEAAVDKCITTGGLVFVAAAGNDGLNACDYSPAGSLKAITVGATSISDRIAFFSNHGNCTDIFAPGVDITSSWIGNAMAEKTISGTSMAAPFVSGIAAILLSQETTLRLGVLNNCERIKAKIVGQSTKHIISDMPVWAGGRNRLLFAGSEAETEEDRLLGTHEETNIIKDL